MFKVIFVIFTHSAFLFSTSIDKKDLPPTTKIAPTKKIHLPKVIHSFT